MRFQHIIEQVYHRAWYITPAGHSAIDRIVRARLLGEHLGARSEDDSPGLSLEDLFVQRRPLAIDSEGIATVHVYGPLAKGISKLEKTCGCTGYEDLRDDLQTAFAQARGILLHVDSPGGGVIGCQEVAEMIAASSIPLVAYSEDCMCSAAYFLAAGADAIVVSPSSYVGSIGVYIPWVDYSAEMAARGLKPDPVVNTGGEFKAIGFTGSLTPEHRAHWQESVDEDFAAFSSHVLLHRDIAPETMRGQAVSGRVAVTLNLADQLGNLSAARAKLVSLVG